MLDICGPAFEISRSGGVDVGRDSGEAGLVGAEEGILLSRWTRYERVVKNQRNLTLSTVRDDITVYCLSMVLVAAQQRRHEPFKIPH